MARDTGEHFATLVLRRSVRVLDPIPRRREARGTERVFGDDDRHPEGQRVERHGRGMRDHNPGARQRELERRLAPHAADRLVPQHDRAPRPGANPVLHLADVIGQAHAGPAAVELWGLQRHEDVPAELPGWLDIDAEPVQAGIVGLAESVAPQAPVTDAVILTAPPVAVVNLVPVAHQRRLHDRLLVVGHAGDDGDAGPRDPVQRDLAAGAFSQRFAEVPAVLLPAVRVAGDGRRIQSLSPRRTTAPTRAA
jgi:hypothetical protein